MRREKDVWDPSIDPWCRFFYCRKDRTRDAKDYSDDQWPYEKASAKRIHRGLEKNWQSLKYLPHIKVDFDMRPRISSV
jgi:hypothetical protein